MFYRKINSQTQVAMMLANPEEMHQEMLQKPQELQT
jgi:hypothetical protein